MHISNLGGGELKTSAKCFIAKPASISPIQIFVIPISKSKNEFYQYKFYNYLINCPVI